MVAWGGAEENPFKVKAQESGGGARNWLSGKAPGSGEDVVLFGKKPEHAVHVFGQWIFAGDLAHPGKVVYFLDGDTTHITMSFLNASTHSLVLLSPPPKRPFFSRRFVCWQPNVTVFDKSPWFFFSESSYWRWLRPTELEALWVKGHGQEKFLFVSKFQTTQLWPEMQQICLLHHIRTYKHVDLIPK